MRIFGHLFFGLVALYVGASCVLWGAANFQSDSLLANTKPPPPMPLSGVPNWSLIEWFSKQGSTSRLNLDEKDLVLEYMSWPGERQKALNSQSETLQKLVQRSPASSNAWLRLLNVQNEIGLPLEEIEFSLKNALLGADWHLKSSPNLIYYCFALDAKLSEAVRSLCDGVILHYPWKTNFTYQAKGMRVDVNELANRLAKLKRIPIQDGYQRGN